MQSGTASIPVPAIQMVRVELAWSGTTLTAPLGQSAPLRIHADNDLPFRPAGYQRIESPQQGGLVAPVPAGNLFKETQAVVESDRAV
jgi:hypothetical protein